MKIVAIVQARMGSTRLPGKVMKPLGGMTLIGFLLTRLSKSELINEIVVATSLDSSNDQLIEYVESLGYKCVRGNERNVLNRYYQAASESNADVVVRITGDCPLIDPQIVDDVISGFLKNSFDYYSNIQPPTFPDGLDVEVFTYASLEKANTHATTNHQKEHVTPYIRDSESLTRGNLTYRDDLSSLRWTVDEPSDYNVVRAIVNSFAPEIHFSMEEIIALKNKSPDIFKENGTINRNEGAVMGTGQKLWRRAKQIIPGGNMLLSKRPEMFLPDQWPAYFSKSKGCTVWDLDHNKYTDMSIMGIGTNILGYANEEVDKAVIDTVNKGNMSTLNCPEEVYLAEKLIEMHPWADMVRFARSGGEANAIAIRIARAATGKDKVAVCGYHGWHDWYLSANLGDDQNLAGHLLPGLEPNGVPSNLKGTVLPFVYNDIDAFEKLVTNNDIGVVKMEVVRNMGPENGFLHRVREITSKKGIVLIFDECTSGFRESFGGIHKNYGVEPDVAMFGKALGNGYAITATIGRKEIMEAAQTSFISSTFWTERIGSAAALKTLEIMERDQTWNVITNTGNEIRRRWQDLANYHELEISHWGIPALTGFSFNCKDALKYKTLISQEMLKDNYLASNSVYVSIEHTKEVVDAYFDHLNPIFGIIKECEEGRNIDDLLQGPICHSGFKRLN